MAVTVTCPGCAAAYPVSEEILGKKIRCKNCSEAFVATATKVAARASPRMSDEDERPVRTAAKPAGSSGLLIGGIAGGLIFLAMGAVTAWAVFFKGDTTSETPAVVSGGPSTKINLDSAKAPPVKVTEPEAKAEPPAPKVEPQKVDVAVFTPAVPNLPFGISGEKINRVKESAVWVKLTGGTGSGWFAEPGIVITNAHVVGMKEPAQAAPASIKIVIHTGVLGREKEFPGELLGLDRENDLAVIRVTADGLPPPMPITRSSDLTEGQKLYTIGFPKGAGIASEFTENNLKVVTNVKSRETVVAGRMPTASGGIKYVQLEGGVDGGNSGGMVVDTTGHVRCVVVSEIRGSNMRFAIPCEYAVYLLQGRLLRVVPSQCYEGDDGKVKQELTALVADPMKRIKKVGLDLWCGEPGKKLRPTTESKPVDLPGESAKSFIELPYDANTRVALGESIPVKGSCNLPALKTGQIYWIQPRYVSTEGKERWGEAMPLELSGQPVKRKPASLVIKHEANREFKVSLKSNIGVGAAPEGNELHLRSTNVNLDLTEKTKKLLPEGSAQVEFKYNELQFVDEDTQAHFKTMMRGVLEAARGMTTEMIVTNRGFIRSPKPILKQVPVPIRPFLEQFNVQTVQSLEALALALPGKEVQAGETWTQGVNYTITLGGQLTENALMNNTYRYVGTRTRNGRDEAVIEFEGQVVRGSSNAGAAPPPEAETPAAPKGKGGDGRPVRLKTRGIHGRVRGAALVDLQTGIVTLARTRAELEFEVERFMQTVKFGAGMRIELHRQVVADTAKPDFDRLLPNQELLLNPFVGSPDVSLSLGRPALPRFDRKTELSPR